MLLLPSAVVSIPQYGCTTWTMYIEKNPESSNPQNRSCTVNDPQSLETFGSDQQDHRNTAGEVWAST